MAWRRGPCRPTCKTEQTIPDHCVVSLIVSVALLPHVQQPIAAHVPFGHLRRQQVWPFGHPELVSHLPVSFSWPSPPSFFAFPPFPSSWRGTQTTKHGIRQWNQAMNQSKFAKNRCV